MVLKRDYEKKEIVKAVAEMWAPLTQAEKRVLLHDIHIKNFKKNHFIYKASDLPTRMMVLIQGKVKIYKLGRNGRSQIIRAIKPMEFFGFRAYFANELYKTEAMALENAEVAFFNTETIVKLMKENFHISLFFLNYLSKELGQSDDRTVNLTQKHIRGRLAEALLLLKNNFGSEEEDDTLSIHLSREDLASLSNMTTSNAIRTLSNFANENLIAIDGRKIKIVNSDELIKISQFG